MLRYPHCFTDVPNGASVCTGCGAELHYGAPPYFYALSIVLALFIGTYLGNTLHGGKWFGTISGAVVLAGFAALIKRGFRRRVTFTRHSRTRN